MIGLEVDWAEENADVIVMKSGGDRLVKPT